MSKKKESRKKLDYWGVQKKSLLNSFKIFKRKKFYRAAFFDFLTILSIVLVLNLAAAAFYSISNYVLPDLINVNQFGESEDKEVFNQALLDLEPLLKRARWQFFVVSLASYLLIVLAISALYGTSWRIILGKKFSRVSFIKYFVYNLVWFALLVALFMFITKTFSSVIAAILASLGFILVTYLDPVFRKSFDEKVSFKKNLSTFWKIGSKIHLFVLFLLITYIFMFCLVLISNLFLKSIVLFGIYWFICLLFLVGWVRSYITQIINKSEVA